MKPDWKDAPDGANYLAMDQDGSWAWFWDDPMAGSDCWFAKYGTKWAVAQRAPLREITLPSGHMWFEGDFHEDWGNSLEARP